MNFKQRIQDGLDGKYQGLPNGLKRLNRYVYGIQRQWYYLYGGLSGSAKTTLVDFKLLRALEYCERNKIEIDVFYYSFEINKEKKIANLLSCHIFNKHKRVIQPQKILGLGKNRMNKEEEEIVLAELPYIEKLFSKINFRFDPLNPTGIFKELYSFYEKTGEFKKRKYKKTVTDAYGNERLEDAETHEGYIHNNPERYVLLVIDHLALCKSENGKSIKETIDKISEYTIFLRNICGLTALLVQQFNQGLNSVERQKFKGVDISPQQSDFKDSSNPYTDCDTAFGIMNPYKMDMEEYLDYDLTILKNRFRMLKIIKNRGGADNIAIGLQFIPEGGYLKELPEIKDMDIEMYRKIKMFNDKLDFEMQKAGLNEESWDEYIG